MSEKYGENEPIPFDEEEANRLLRFLGEQPYAKVAPIIDIMGELVKDYVHNFLLAQKLIEEKATRAEEGIAVFAKERV